MNKSSDKRGATSPFPLKSPISNLKSSLPRTVIALGFVSLFNDASSEIIYPLLPLFITTTLGASLTFVGLVEGVTESTASLLKLPAGWWSDRLSKRKGVVVAGYGIASFIRPLLALTTAAWQVLGLRFVDRIGKGIRSAPRDAMIADAAPANARGLAFGFHRAMDHAGAIVGALLAAWLVGIFQNDYRRVFWVAAIPALLGLLVLLLFVREPKHEALSAKPPLKLDLSLFSSTFKQFLAVLLLFTLSNSSDAFLLLRAEQCGVRPAMIPLLWALLHVSKTVSSIIGGGLSDRFGRRKLIVSGWVLYAAIYLGFAIASTSALMWVLFAIYGFYFGLCEGAEKALITDLVPPATRGTAFGFYNLVIGIGALPASLLLGFLWQRFGAETALITSAVISLLATVWLGAMKYETYPNA
ncbi:MAG TPA: MFS transporter [Blastocatellia bacterium]|nr:MFS transporter [Blastocatellia bacterium]